MRPFQAAAPKRGEGAPAPGAPREGGGGPGGGGGEDRTLYLGNLPYDASVQEVEQMFQRAGVSPVVRVNLPLDPNGRPRGFGFVTLGSAEAAQGAVEALREAELRGRRVSASIAHARGERPRGPRPGGPTGGPGGGFGGPPWGGRPEGRWGGPGDGPPPGELPLPGDEGSSDDRRRRGPGPRDAAGPGKKKPPSGKSDRSRSRREGEGLRAPRARDRYDDDD